MNQNIHVTQNPETIYKIIDCLRNPHTSFVYSERSTGKTRALIDYIAERTLLRAGRNLGNIYVFSPTSEFNTLFSTYYPSLDSPIVNPAIHTLRGQKDSTEIYLDEFETLITLERERLKEVRYMIKGGVSSMLAKKVFGTSLGVIL